MKVVRQELGHELKLLAPAQGHDAAFPFDQAATPKLLYGAVDVHSRKAANISEILLSERKTKLILLQKPYDFEPGRKLAENMRHSG